MSKSGLRIEPQSLKFLREIPNHANKMRKGTRRAFYNIGKANTKLSRDLIKKGPKTGRLYRIAGRKRRHRASAPGEAPANRTGFLRKNVDFVVRGDDQMEFGDKAPYGLFLEMGTKRMKPRKHLEPAVKANYRYAMQELSLQPLRELQR